MKKITVLISAVTLSVSNIAQATTWLVGPSQTYTMPSQVKPLVSDGDTIKIAGGTYNNDAVKWDKKNLKFFGLGNSITPTVIKYTGDIPNGKGIWVFEQPGISDNPYIENITFDGAQVSDSDGGNGAGIRFQAKDITIKNCKFFNCQNGILEGNNAVNNSNFYLEGSEFYNNGYGGTDNSYIGYEHNIYIDAGTDSLWVKNCYFHSPKGEANSLKTRAQRSWILNNYIDEDNGNGSWELNLAQGGLCIVMGNVIVQGTSGANHGIISIDAALNPINEIYFINNTVINKFGGNVKFFANNASAGITTFKYRNNVFASINGASNTWLQGAPSMVDTLNNRYLTDYTSVGFVNPSAGNYNISATAFSLVNTGINAGTASNGYSLTPLFMYNSYSLIATPRVISGGVIDIGAYEYTTTITGFENTNLEKALIKKYFDNNVLTVVLESGNFKKLVIYDINGKQVYTTFENTSKVDVNMAGWSKGIYIVKSETESGKIECDKILNN